MGDGRAKFARLLAAVCLGLIAAPTGAQPAAPAPTARPPAPAGPLPIEALAALPGLSDPSLSPDGWRIVGRVTVEGKTRIAVWDLHTPEAAPHLLSPGNDQLRWLRWGGPGRLLLGVQTTASYDHHIMPVTRIIAVETSGWTARMLDTGRGFLGDDVIFVDPAGAYVLVSSQPSVDQYPAVVRVDLATGASV